MNDRIRPQEIEKILQSALTSFHSDRIIQQYRDVQQFRPQSARSDHFFVHVGLSDDSGRLLSLDVVEKISIAPVIDNPTDSDQDLKYVILVLENDEIIAKGACRTLSEAADSLAIYADTLGLRLPLRYVIKL
jgi:hypothetical protein